jgi:hypothetical protein
MTYVRPLSHEPDDQQVGRNEHGLAQVDQADRTSSPQEDHQDSRPEHRAWDPVLSGIDQPHQSDARELTSREPERDQQDA